MIKLFQLGGSESTSEASSSARDQESDSRENSGTKVDARAWTLTEGKPKASSDPGTQSPSPLSPVDRPRGAFQGFFSNLVAAGVAPEDVLRPTAMERGAEEEFRGLMFEAVLTRERSAVSKAQRRSLRDHLASLPGVVAPEKSEYVYDVATWPLRASNKVEFTTALLKIKEVLEVRQRFKELLIIGDQQTWKYMDELKTSTR